LGLTQTPWSSDLMCSTDGLHVAADADGHAVVGATRWPWDGGSAPDKTVVAQKLASLCRERLSWLPVEQWHGLWTGIRCVQPHKRQIVADALPDCPGIWVLGALGSTGLLWGPLGAWIVAQSVVKGDLVSQELAAFSEGSG
jgi:glycine/D-amino acid oxidase-like deaminating enzyme